jgi:putative ABC transport system permease protein
VARRSALSLIGDTSRASTAPRGVLRVRAGFIVAQMALSLCLLIAAGLLVRSFVRLQERPLGFRTGTVLSGSLTLTTDRYRDLAERELFLQELTTRLRALPDVEGAAAISTLPLSGADARRPYQIPGQTTSEVLWTQFRVVTPQYFDVMDIPLRRGRRFDDRDRAGSTQVAIINERLARTLWPAEDPIGKIMLVPDVAPPAQAREIIGVVGDVRHNGLTADIPLELYRPASQTTWPFFSVVVRTTGEPERLIPSVRAAVAAIDRTITIGNSLRPLDQLAADSIGTRQVTMTLVSVFAVTALTLALVGVYGLVAYLVAQRTREFGVRLALGARQAHIHATVFRQVLAPVIVGLVVGIAAALAGAGLLQSQLFEVAPHDPLTFVIVAVAFLGTGVLAMLVPARRAAVLDPVTALRRD